jgi:hypothetical protein
VRATKDIDIWVHATVDNAARVLAALVEFGAPTHGTSIEDLTTPDYIIQIGVAPVRIDILTSIPGVTFDDAWADRLQTTFAGEPVGVLSKQHLIQNKTAVGRPQDLADVDALRRM